MAEGEIFIVDDNPANLALLAGVLKGAGYRVRMAKSGRLAFQMMKNDPPELIMLDIQMPEMDGYEVCQLLKNEEATRSIPVIFISALDDVFDKVKGFNAGGVDYVTKPFQAEEILARVASQMNLFRLQRELERRNAELKQMYDEVVRSQRKAQHSFTAFADLLPGTVLNDTYQLDAKIGEGGFGVVFRGHHCGLQRPVAIKVLRPTGESDAPEHLARFQIEGIAACRINHPNAVEALDFGVTSSGIAYLVMELLRGYTLGWVLETQGRLPVVRSAQIVVKVCEALAEAHASGIIHRDIKPENIFLHQTKRGEVVKVVDFGIAKLMDEQAIPDMMNTKITGTGVLIGTPHYMAPERFLDDEYDGKADVYSVGVIFYEMVSGRGPFAHASKGIPGTVVIQHVMKKPRPLHEVVADVPEAIERMIMRALEKDPDFRQTAKEFAEELSAAIDGLD